VMRELSPIERQILQVLGTDTGRPLHEIHDLVQQRTPGATRDRVRVALYRMEHEDGLVTCKELPPDPARTISWAYTLTDKWKEVPAEIVVPPPKPEELQPVIDHTANAAHERGWPDFEQQGVEKAKAVTEALEKTLAGMKAASPALSVHPEDFDKLIDVVHRLLFVAFHHSRFTDVEYDVKTTILNSLRKKYTRD
jgi:hypothetical protein